MCSCTAMDGTGHVNYFPQNLALECPSKVRLPWSLIWLEFQTQQMDVFSLPRTKPCGPLAYTHLALLLKLNTLPHP